MDPRRKCFASARAKKVDQGRGESSVNSYDAGSQPSSFGGPGPKSKYETFESLNDRNKALVPEMELTSAPPSTFLESPQDSSTEESQVGELFQKAFGIDLIRDKLVIDLNYSDFKNLGQLTSDLYWIVRNCQKFQNSSLFVLTVSKCTEEFHPPSDFELIWKHIEIDVSEVLQTLYMKKTKPFESTLRRRLSTAITLGIHCKICVAKNDPMNNSPKFKIPILEVILNSIPTVQSLTLGLGILYVDLSKILSQENVRRSFEGMKELHVVSGQRLEYILHTSRVSSAHFLNNINALFGMSMKLEALSWTNVNTPPGMDPPPFSSFLQKLRSTLVRLSLDSTLWSNKSFMAGCDMELPKLNSLKINTANIHTGDAKLFLEKQKKLEILEISVEEKFPDMILMVIQSQIWKLKHLCLRCGSGSSLMTCFNGMNFELIQDFELLLNYKPNLNPEISYSHYSQVLQILPVNLKRLNLRGLNPISDIASEMERFTNLTELSLLNNYDVENGQNYSRSIGCDQLLQTIFREITNLRVFRVSNSDKITNFGLTGIVERNGDMEQTGVSIQNLKNLRELVIVNCPNIKNFGLTTGIKFSELRFILLVRSRCYWYNGWKGCYFKLAMGPEPEVNLETWKTIVEQNPRLSTVILKSKKSLCKDLKSINPSINRVYNIWNRAGKSQNGYIHDIPCSKFYEDLYYTDIQADREN